MSKNPITLEQIREILQKQETLICFYKPVLNTGNLNQIKLKLENGELLMYVEILDHFVSTKLLFKTFEIFNTKPEFFLNEKEIQNLLN